LFKIWYNSKNIVKINKSFDLLVSEEDLVGPPEDNVGSYASLLALIFHLRSLSGD